MKQEPMKVEKKKTEKRKTRHFARTKSPFK